MASDADKIAEGRADTIAGGGGSDWRLSGAGDVFDFAHGSSKHRVRDF